ncbi:MAG: ABC transporter permease, partial [Gemmatimonadaceae bacterium]
MPIRLALAALLRHRARSALAVIGVAISTAMLLDMVMLATGLRESFRELLSSQGFQLRLSPRGSLPFDTDAAIPRASEIVELLERRPEVDVVSPVLGATVHVIDADPRVTAFALGIDAAVQGDYVLLDGHDPRAPNTMVANDELLRVARARLGDTLRLGTGYDPQLLTHVGERRVVVTGRARFRYLAAGQPAAALPFRTLQEMSGNAERDAVSLLMVRAHRAADVERLARWITNEVPRVDAISTREALARADERLRYFRQLSFILGAVSLVVGFLLVTTLVTVSVNERIGEIAVLRAIGVSRHHVVGQVVLEAAAISLAGSALGLGLGLVTARYLSAILSDFPGLPAAIDFFLFQPRAAWLSLGMLVLSGIAAGVYPSWRAASLPIAST